MYILLVRQGLPLQEKNLYNSIIFQELISTPSLSTDGLNIFEDYCSPKFLSELAFLEYLRFMTSDFKNFCNP